MITNPLTNLRSLHHSLHKLLPIHYLSLHTNCDSPKTSSSWNTNHTFIHSNPLLSLLEKCNSLSQLFQIQAQMTTTGLILDGLASSRLIAFCAISQCKNLGYCTKILHNVKNPNVFSWNIAIRGYVESGNVRDGIYLYKMMLGNGERIRPDNYTYPLLFKGCANLELDCYIGYELFVHVVELGLASDVFVNNAVIHLMVSAGELRSARRLFDESSVRDLVSWNSLINGYVRRGRAFEALKLFREMEEEGVRPDEVTMIGVASSCGQLEDLKRGREFHMYVEESGLTWTIPLANTFLDMYVKCGNLEAAQKLYDSMTKKTLVSSTTMIIGYAKFGFLDTARKFFNDMTEKDVVPWNAMISGYVQAKCGKEALALFHDMQLQNVKPDEVTMVSCLSACSQLGALDVGIWIHHYIEKHKLSLNVAVGTALIDMYAKCGNIVKALEVFRQIPRTNSLTWTALIGGLALHGKSGDALLYFSEMISIGLMPDEVTYLGVLSACCHGGLIEEGRKHFADMTKLYKLSPKLKHYSCMVDLLGRAGLLQEAEELINTMTIEADAVVWGALFFACRVHKNVSMGERAASRLLELDPHDSGIYVLLANMYLDANMWEKAWKVRKMMKDRGVEKTPGCSSIDVNGTVYEFIVREKSHCQSKEIYECLAKLKRQLEPDEHLPNISDSEHELHIAFDYSRRY